MNVLPKKLGIECHNVNKAKFHLAFQGFQIFLNSYTFFGFYWIIPCNIPAISIFHLDISDCLSAAILCLQFFLGHPVTKLAFVSFYRL